MIDVDFGEYVFTYEELQAYMDKKYPHMQYKIKPFQGTVRIPYIVSNETPSKRKK